MPSRSSDVNALYQVPQNLISLSKWLEGNTNIQSGYRYLFLPSAMATLGSFESLFSQNAPVEITPSIYNSFFYQFMNTYNTTILARYFSIIGVEYVVIYKGPYMGDDSSVSYSGSARLNPAGFQYSLTYLPIGSWQSWYSIFENKNSFSLLTNTSSFAVFVNSLYRGIVYSLPIAKNYTISWPNYYKNYTPTLNYTIFNGNFYENLSNEMPLTGPWYGFNNIPDENFSIRALNNNTEYVQASTSKAGYGNIYIPLNLKPDSLYLLSYEISGVNMSNSNIYIRFYSGENGSGSMLYTFDSPPVNGNVSGIRVNWYFKTPSNFSSVFLFPTVLKFKSGNLSSITNFTLYPIRAYIEEKIVPVNYIFENPTQIFINQKINNNSYLLFVSNFNNGWILRHNGTISNSSEFDMGFLKVNSFKINNATGFGSSIYFSDQAAYSVNLVIKMGIFTAISVLSIAGYLIRKVKKGERY